MFLNCQERPENSIFYVCDDQYVLQQLELLEIRKIDLESKFVKVRSHEVSFMIQKSSYYPIISYLYQECGTKKFFESATIL